MPAKGKGKRKVTTGPMDPRKTREPVTGHPDGDVNAALDSVMMSPPHTDKDYDSDTGKENTVIEIAKRSQEMADQYAAGLNKMQSHYEAEIVKLRELALSMCSPERLLTTIFRMTLELPIEDQPRAAWLARELTDMLEVNPTLSPEEQTTFTELTDAHEATTKTQTNTQATQTPAPPQPATIREAMTQTPKPPTRSYAEAATSTTPPPEAAPTKKDKGKQPTFGPNAASRQSPSPPPRTPTKTAATVANKVPLGSRKPVVQHSRTIVLHAAPTKYKAGQMRRWIEEDNKGMHISSIRWLLSDQRRDGKRASSLVIYMMTSFDTNKRVRMGDRTFRITAYDWER